MKDMGLSVENELLMRWAENQARSMAVGGRVRTAPVARRLSVRLRKIESLAARIGLWAEKNRPLPQEFEWLLDNRYLISREGGEAARIIRRAGKLPADASRPAVRILADALVRSGRGMVTPERIAIFLEGAQKSRALLEKELWLFVPMLRAALLDMIADLCAEMDDMLASYRRPHVSDPFAAEQAVWRARECGAMPPSDAEALAQGAQAAHSRLAMLIGATITSLRTLSVTDVSETLRAASVVETLLSEDPAGVYDKMDEISRERYRQEISRLAKRNKLPEDETVRRILALCRKESDPRKRHVGMMLLKTPMGVKPGSLSGVLYFGGQWALAALLSVAGALLSGVWWTAFLLVFPAFDMAKNVVDLLVVRLTHPRPIPRLDLPDGIPAKAATLCVVSVLLTDSKLAAAQVKKLESFRFANRDAGGHLLFGVLADLPDAPSKHLTGDRKIMEEAQKAVFELNRKHGGGYYLFLRDRELNLRDGRFIGWERKRGALLELFRLIRGKPTGLRVATGDRAALNDVRYVITLDGDTELTPGAAKELVGGMMHPLSTPIIDKKKNVVVEGYGIILPRMAVDLHAAGRSLFTRIFAGQGGLDPYGGLSGDVYHDLFDAGSFTGKGIFDVDAGLAVLDGRLPENRILSHDLLEGAYLRAGLMGDLELTDGYPSKVTALFDRLHRWTRGDWQNGAWLGRRVPTARGKERNPISGLSRWKIFDNLRRSLTTVVLLLLLTAGLLLRGKVWLVAGGAAVLAALSNLLLSAAELAFRGKAGRGALYHSTIITGLRAVFLQTLFQLIFLPYAAFTSAHAIVTSLYRLFISHRKLLQWVTAAQSDRSRQNAVALARKMFPGVAWGVLTACLSPHIFGWICGVAWALSPLLAAAISRVSLVDTDIPDADRAFLLRQAALMWQYFDDLLTPADNYLPPDNWQEQPAAGIAHRTSPTNIGLALLCTLSAVDLNLCPLDKALHLIDRTLDTLEKLPKWHGHILNWYDTRTLEPLRPRCVSTVDSGNLAGYLIALCEGLSELGDAAAEDLAARARALADAMDFAPLYDRHRKLFSISYDMEKEALSDGYYDLLASEARQTSYLAIASGQVDRRHWQRLGRAMSGEDQYRGLASWTGTMFEFFMPHLLLPVYDNSLLYESLHFALYCQRKRGMRHKVPWGISESCFYAFDAALNYQYKAHGVPSLAYKRGVGKEMVISPYSTFLTLRLRPDAACRNLRRLRELGLEGKYGFYEAADYTPARLTGKDKFETVRCFMSHHIGMSILSVSNVLMDNIWQKRFMRDPAMGSFAGLLQERVPVGGSTLRPAGREIPEKPKRAAGEGLYREMSGMHPDIPRCHLLTNSSYSILCTDTGLSASRCMGMAVTRFEATAHGAGGLRFFLRTADGATSLLPAPAYQNLGAYKAVFEGGRACWDGQFDLFRSQVTAWIPENENAEVRAVQLTNCANAQLTGELLCYFEPVMQAAEDFESHPAFSKLFLETSGVQRGLLVRRRPRTGREETHLAFLCDDERARFDTSREHALGRGGEDVLKTDKPLSASGTIGVVLDPCVLAVTPVSLQPGGSLTVRFALSVAGESRDALAAAERALMLRDISSGGRMDGVIRLLGLTQTEAVTALDWLTPLVFPVDSVPDALGHGLALGQQGLWKFGISGDFPILTAKAMDAVQIEKLGRVVRQHRLLSLCGQNSDLVVLCRDGGHYLPPVRTALLEALKSLGCEQQLGARGGIHLVDLSSMSGQEEALLLAVSRLSAEQQRPPAGEYVQAVPVPSPAREQFSTRPPRYLSDGAFQFDAGGNLPPVAWSHVLASPSYGALVTECSSGYMWRRNARENKMIPWTNDPLATRGGEHIGLRLDGVEFSVFADSDGLPCTVTYGFGYARWEKRAGKARVTTTAFVPIDRMARVLVVEIEGANDALLTYRAQVAMGVNANNSRYILLSQDTGDLIRAENPYSVDFSPQTFAVAASVPPKLLPGRPGEIVAEVSPVRREGRLRIVFVTGCAQNKPGLHLLRALADDREADLACRRTMDHWARLVRPFPIETPDEDLKRYLDGWALYQVIACRLYARTSLYQCGGAYGFRDQLQDACAALFTDPGLTKNQILRACAHQYEEGDSQHWWHPGQPMRGEGDKGVRTRCSDDLLWLPYAVCEYLDKTGDHSILLNRAPFIASTPLKPNAHDRYETPRRTGAAFSVFEHCVRAVDLALHRGVGIHGLALIGAGDWNDGFNLVGDKGHGESVWLTWFLAYVLKSMAALCDAQGDIGRAGHYRVWSDKLISAGIAAWDGDWFRRGYYDDGSTLGSHIDEECRIDSIAQSWAALLPLPPDYVGKALESACKRLVDPDAQVVRLFEPAFVGSNRNPGYIKGYVAGVRENGGQYTHAAVWLAMGCLLAGKRDMGERVLLMLLPAKHPPEIYKTEPHVLAADVYYNAAHTGRGGWTHYTGAASWYYRVAVGLLLGLRPEQRALPEAPKR